MVWDAAKPAGSQKIRLSDEEIRANWAALQGVISAEHHFPNTGQDGEHKFPVEEALPSGAEGRISIHNNLLYWYSNSVWRTLIPSGTKMIFLQASAPTGWTQDAALNDRVLRLVSATGGGTGGDWTMTALKAAGHALTVSELPAHHHTYSLRATTINAGSGGAVANANISDANTGDTGSGSSHTHDLDNSGDWRPAYADVIACTKV